MDFCSSVIHNQKRGLSDSDIDAIRCRTSLPMLSEIYLEIAEIVGEEAALRLARFIPGQWLTFPKRPRPDSMISLLLTPDQIAALRAHFGNDRVKLTTAWHYLNMLDARAMRAEGKSIAYIVRTLRIAQATVEHYLQGQPVGSPSEDDLRELEYCLSRGDDPREVSIKTGFGINVVKSVLFSSSSKLAITHIKPKDQ